MCPFPTPVRMAMCIHMPKVRTKKDGVYSKYAEYKTSNWHPNDLYVRN